MKWMGYIHYRVSVISGRHLVWRDGEKGYMQDIISLESPIQGA